MNAMTVSTLEWVGSPGEGFLRLLDQTKLPNEVAFNDCHAVEEVWEAIKSLQVRGAPAIGIAAAYGVVLGVRTSGDVRSVCAYLAKSRPTAVNLFWALDRMQQAAEREPADDRIAMIARLWREANQIHQDDAQTGRRIAEQGVHLIEDGMGVLTHCNAGALATAAWGTALAPIFLAHEHGKRFTVYVDETRPLLQGARLTAWELTQRGIDTVLLCDSMAGHVMSQGKIQRVIVGADRIAANGDTANKIGTYSLAVLAQAHDIPLIIAAPSSSFDRALPDGQRIPIEVRDPREVTHGFGLRTAPEGVRVYNPAFDVTPASLIHAILTEKGLIQPVTSTMIAEVLSKKEISNASS